MNLEQRANIKFCFKLGQSFSETFQLLKKEPKYSLRNMEIELNNPKDSIYRILTEELNIKKVRSQYVVKKNVQVEKMYNRYANILLKKVLLKKVIRHIYRSMFHVLYLNINLIL